MYTPIYVCLFICVFGGSAQVVRCVCVCLSVLCVCLPACSRVAHMYYSVHMGVKDDFGCQPLLSTLFKMGS